MENKFYKLVDGILWADWPEPDERDYTEYSEKYFETILTEWQSRPRYPLSGTLEGKKRYELGVDFVIKSATELWKEQGRPDMKGDHYLAIPIAQPVSNILSGHENLPQGYATNSAQPVEGEKEKSTCWCEHNNLSKAAKSNCLDWSDVNGCLRNKKKQEDAGTIYWYQPLFNLMSKEHNLTLLKSEMDDIISVVQKMLNSDTDDERSVATTDQSGNESQ